MGKLMHDFSCKDPKEMNYGRLADRVSYFKEDKEGVKDMSRSMEEFAKRWAEEETQIRNEEVDLELLRMDVMDYENVVKVSKLSVEEVKKLAELQLV